MSGIQERDIPTRSLCRDLANDSLIDTSSSPACANRMAHLLRAERIIDVENISLLSELQDCGAQLCYYCRIWFLATCRTKTWTSSTQLRTRLSQHCVIRKLLQACSSRNVFPSLSCGVRVIYSGLGEPVDFLVSNKCGIAVQPEARARLAEAISSFASDKRPRNQMGLNGWAFVEREYS
jgi:glycosyltransferase involved in cell wall biosynthesis